MDHSHSRRPLPSHAWLGIAVLLIAQALYFLHSRFIEIWLTPIMWTGTIMACDGFVYILRGRSWLTDRRREFPLLAILSVGVWLIFEAYNLHLRNWVYQGLPTTPWLRDFGYFWSFATIMPAVFESADLVEALLERKTRSQAARARPGSVAPEWAWFLAGVAMVSIPLALPEGIASFLFAAVWLGFVFLLDPIQRRLGYSGFRQALQDGRTQRVGALLLGGLLCGFLWETWNYQAYVAQGGHWIYTVPAPLRVFGWHFGQMPLLGLLGFPPFALELEAFYVILREFLGGDRIWRPNRDLHQPPEFS